VPDLIHFLSSELIDPLIAGWRQPAFWLAVGQIIGIDFILAGDNAVVIAMACRMLAPRQRLWGMILGAGVAIVLRVVFTVLVTQALVYPFLKIAGALALVWIAVKLLVPDDAGSERKVIHAADRLWRAVWIVAVADIVMSLDNVIAIAAAAESAAARLDAAHAAAIKSALIVFGLGASIPMIVAGSAVVLALLVRYPSLVWIGSAILGWVAGEIIVKDAALVWWIAPQLLERVHNYVAASGVLIVLALGYLLVRRRRLQAERDML
jgi:YjbE family integral membrane protein